MSSGPHRPIGPVTTVVQQETSVLLAHPALRPDRLIEALRRELSALATVKGAWLMLASRADEPQQTWMLGVEQDGSWTDVQAALGRAIRLNDLDGKPLDAIEIGRSELADTLRTGLAILKRRGGFRAWLGF